MATIEEMGREYADPAYPDKLCAQLEGYRFTLDPDPLEYGPGRLAQKVAEARNAKEACNHLLGNFYQVLSHFQSRKNLAEGLLKMEIAEKLTNDPTVRGGRSTGDRTAIAMVLLRARGEEVEDLKQKVFHLESLIGVLKVKIADLTDASSRLQEQIRLCHAQLSTGARWGQKLYAPPTPGVPAAPAPEAPSDGPSMDEVMRTADDINARNRAAGSEFETLLDRLPTLSG